MDKKDCDSKFSFSLSLLNIFKLRIFDTIYAKGPASEIHSPRKEHWQHSGSPRKSPKDACSAVGVQKDPCADKSAGGDAPFNKACKCRPDGKSSAGDRGKTGAGVTGSRAGRTCEKDSDNLPAGAINPGLLRHIHNAARYRLPQCFEGACVSVKHSAKSNWVFGHSLSFSSVSPGGYKVLMSYVDKEKPASLPYFVMEAAPGGQMSCEMRVNPTQGTRATVVAQIAEGEFYSFESIMDAYFNRFTASVIAVNREFIALHYLQVGFAIRRAVATLAYEWHTEEWTVRGSADSDGLVGATLQRSLGGKRSQLACAISALLNHPNDKFRLGFGVTAAIF
ncbi:hypothetical protein HF086_003908 [Spodoptera exigua]|uniref:Uncharacterized protein n=1 Tax=Spodoptera exigua TaxID=7107 RepID=A0A922MT34_SPOEX|nr:hypothetical protein HF086_003908 [Spodoptera exigua]